MGILSLLVGKLLAKISICNMKRSKDMEVVVTWLDQALNLTVGSRAGARTLIGGGDIHILGLCPTKFF